MEWGETVPGLLIPWFYILKIKTLTHLTYEDFDYFNEVKNTYKCEDIVSYK